MWFVMRRWTPSWWLSLWFSLFSKLTFTNCIFHFYPMLLMIINSADKKHKTMPWGQLLPLWNQNRQLPQNILFHPLCYSQGLCVILRVIKMASWQCNFILWVYLCICAFSIWRCGIAISANLECIRNIRFNKSKGGIIEATDSSWENTNIQNGEIILLRIRQCFLSWL